MYNIKSVINDLNSCDKNNPNEIQTLTLKASIIITSYLKISNDDKVNYELSKINGRLVHLIAECIKPSKTGYSKVVEKIINRLTPAIEVHVDTLNQEIVSMYTKKFGL